MLSRHPLLALTILVVLFGSVQARAAVDRSDGANAAAHPASEGHHQSLHCPAASSLAHGLEAQFLEQEIVAADAIDALTLERPDWSPAEMESALMSTATALRSTHCMEAAAVNADRAAAAGFVLEQASTSGGMNRPWLSAADCDGHCAFVRTLKGVAEPAHYTVRSIVPAGVTVSTYPSSFSIAAGERLDVVIDVAQEESVNGAFAWLSFESEDSSLPDQHMPLLLANHGPEQKSGEQGTALSADKAAVELLDYTVIDRQLVSLAVAIDISSPDSDVEYAVDLRRPGSFSARRVAMGVEEASDEIRLDVSVDDLVCGTSYELTTTLGEVEGNDSQVHAIPVSTLSCFEDQGVGLMSCQMGVGNGRLDPTLGLLLIIAILGLAVRRRSHLSGGPGDHI